MKSLIHAIVLSHLSDSEMARRNYLAPKERHSSKVTKKVIINTAKQTLESLRFKNERIFALEKFSSKLHISHDELSDCGREVTNGDAVDSSWYRIQSQDIMVNFSTLKVHY